MAKYYAIVAAARAGIPRHAGARSQGNGNFPAHDGLRIKKNSPTKPRNAGMSATLIAPPRDRRQEAAILAAIALLHVLLIALLWREMPLRRARAAAPALALVQLGGAASGDALIIEPAAATPHGAARPASAAHPAPRATAPARAQTAPMTTAGATPAPGAPSAPIDWFSEQDRVANDAAAKSTAPPPRGFGVPEVPREYAPPKSDFGWSHSRTHRVEPIEGGGIAINLSDQCVLVLIPLPLIGCALGKRPANGDLFRHLHDPAHPGDWKDSTPLQVP
jgi:hypothetical protein